MFEHPNSKRPKVGYIVPFITEKDNIHGSNAIIKVLKNEKEEICDIGDQGSHVHPT